MVKSMLRKRPFGVTLLLWLVLSLLAWGLVRFFATLRAWDVLLEFGSSLSPLYLSITGAGWAVAGGVLLWSMFVGKKWTHQAVLTSISVWLIEYWLERVFFQQARANLPFAIFGSLLILGITIISTHHKSTRNFFTRSEEYEQQNEDPGSA
jgi:hypothetical protein